MSTAMLVLIVKARSLVAKGGAEHEVHAQPFHHALCLVWRNVTRSARYEGTWKGPGVYRFSGYEGEEGSVATVEWSRPLPQLEFDFDKEER